MVESVKNWQHSYFEYAILLVEERDGDGCD